MFPRKFSIIVASLLVLCLLCSCAQSNPPEIPDPTISAPTEDTTEPSTESVETPTEDTSALTPEAEVSTAEGIYVYPFTEEKLKEAEAIVREYMLDFDPELVKEIDVHYVAFDPYMTDVNVRQSYYNNYDYHEMTLEEIYGLHMTVLVNFAHVYTEDMAAAGAGTDPVNDDAYAYKLLYRSSPDAPWEEVKDGFSGLITPPYLPYEDTLPADTMAQFSLPGCRPIGGYKMEDGDYWIYVWDEETQSSRLVKLDYAAPADLSTAEPRD